MKFTEILRDAWDQMANRQRAFLLVAALLVSLLMISGWADSYGSYRSRKAAEKAASDALERAAKIASQIAKREKEVKALEEKRDEKNKELDTSAADVRRDRDVYDRAVAEPRTDQPTAEQLCRELDALGYSCYR